MKWTGKRWTVAFCAVFLALLVAAGAATIIVDPYFHYHKPLPELQYPLELYKARYLNDGILKHFNYDAIITGSSLTDSFSASEFDRLFNVNAVKTPFGGGSYKEMNDNLKTAVAYNPNIKIIFRCLDYHRLFDAADYMSYSEDAYPRYLYDDLLCNDVKYIFNKSTLFEDTLGVLQYTLQGGSTTNFDSYCNWAKDAVFSKETTDSNYEFPEKGNGVFAENTPQDYEMIRENINQNVANLAEEHPEIEFYLYFSPNNIYFWNNHYQAGTIVKQLDAEKYIIELLLQHNNIHLYSFFTEYDMICDLNNYIDTMHYSEEVHSKILQWMSRGIHELTPDNYQEYCRQEWDFYMNYDYDSLYYK